MATKKQPVKQPVVSKSKVKPKPSTAPGRLHNLAARPPGDDDGSDEQLVDASGVFRVQSSLSRAQQRGREEEAGLRFASDSLVMAAQRDGFREDGPTLDDAVEESSVDDEATAALRRERRATLAARAQARSRPRR